MKKIILLGCFIAFANTLSSQDNDHLIDHTYKLHKVQSITEFIASDELKGRDTPSIGLELAAEYAAEFFENAGLQFAHGLEGYFQPVNMVHKGQPDEIKIRGEQQ